MRSQLLRSLHRSPLAMISARINCRLRRVCSLLHEPTSVAAPPHLPFDSRDVYRSVNRRLKLGAARNLAELNAVHDMQTIDYVCGDIDASEHADLEDTFQLRHREMMRRAATCNPARFLTS